MNDLKGKPFHLEHFVDYADGSVVSNTLLKKDTGKLKQYPHFYGQFGTAWQKQIKEFSKFPGAILMTTNCIQRPKNDYKDNFYTSGMVGWPGIPHISDHDFQAVIDKALAMPGFETDEVTVGFARNAALEVADQVIAAVKNGDIRHFFLVAGCDGAKPGRNYYTEFVEKYPRTASF
jgi:hydroxylamine reductase